MAYKARKQKGPKAPRKSPIERVSQGTFQLAWEKEKKEKNKSRPANPKSKSKKR